VPLEDRGGNSGGGRRRGRQVEGVGGVDLLRPSASKQRGRRRSCGEREREVGEERWREKDERMMLGMPPSVVAEDDRPEDGRKLQGLWY